MVLHSDLHLRADILFDGNKSQVEGYCSALEAHRKGPWDGRFKSKWSREQSVKQQPSNGSLPG